MPFLVVVVGNRGFYFVDNKQGLVMLVVIRIRLMSHPVFPMMWDTCRTVH